MIRTVTHSGMLRLGADLGALVIAFAWGARAAHKGDPPHTPARVKAGAGSDDSAPRVVWAEVAPASRSTAQA